MQITMTCLPMSLVGLAHAIKFPKARETPATPVPAPAPVKFPLVTKHRNDDEPDLVGAAS